MNPQPFHKFARYFRESHNLSQRQVAAALGIDHSQLSKMEAGKLRWYVDEHLAPLAEVCGVSMIQMLFAWVRWTGEDAEEPQPWSDGNVIFVYDPSKPPPVEVVMDGWIKHVHCNGARHHIISWQSDGPHCSEARCIINKVHQEDIAR